jgi:hypothetical protein
MLRLASSDAVRRYILRKLTLGRGAALVRHLVIDYDVAPRDRSEHGSSLPRFAPTALGPHRVCPAWTFFSAATPAAQHRRVCVVGVDIQLNPRGSHDQPSQAALSETAATHAR